MAVLLWVRMNPPSGLVVGKLRGVKPSVEISPELRGRLGVDEWVLGVLGVPDSNLGVAVVVVGLVGDLEICG